MQLVEQCRQGGCFDQKAGNMQMAVEHKRLVGDMFAEYGIILMEITQSTLG